MQLLIEHGGEREALDVEPEDAVVGLVARGAEVFGLSLEPFVRVTNNPIGCEFLDVASPEQDGPRVADWCKWHISNGKTPIFRLLTAAEVEEAERDQPHCRHGSPFKAGHGYLCGWC